MLVMKKLFPFYIPRLLSSVMITREPCGELTVIPLNMQNSYLRWVYKSATDRILMNYKTTKISQLGIWWILRILIGYPALYSVKWRPALSRMFWKHGFSHLSFRGVEWEGGWGWGWGVGWSDFPLSNIAEGYNIFPYFSLYLLPWESVDSGFISGGFNFRKPPLVCEK